MRKQLTAIIEREDDGYVLLCPELDMASQGGTISGKEICTISPPPLSRRERGARH